MILRSFVYLSLFSLYTFSLQGMQWTDVHGSAVPDDISSLLHSIYVGMSVVLEQDVITPDVLNRQYSCNDMRDVTPLTLAMINRQARDRVLNTIRLLHISGADVNYPDGQGMTSLHHAVSICERKIVKFFLDKKSEVNAQAKNGDLPITVASKKISELLVNKGCNSWQAVRQKYKSASNAPTFDMYGTLAFLGDYRSIMLLLLHRDAHPCSTSVKYFGDSLNNLAGKKTALMQMLSNQWGSERSDEPIRMHAAQQMLLLYCLSDYEFLQDMIRFSENGEPLLRWLLGRIVAEPLPRITKESD